MSLIENSSTTPTYQLLSTMSLADLTSSEFDADSSNHQSNTRKRNYAWLLPVGLVLGFLTILALLFGKRLLPAIPVKTAPVITIRASEEISSHAEEKNLPKTSLPVSNKGNMLFQASGWVEPDPYTTYVPTLTNGVVKDVNVLEGETVKKGQLLATLIDEDAKLDLQSSKQAYTGFQKQIDAHCTEYNIIDSEIIAANSKIKAVQSELNEAIDTYTRYSKLRKGDIAEQIVVQAKLAVEKQRAMLAEAEAEITKLDARKVQLESQKEMMEVKLQELGTQRDRAQLTLDRTSIKSPINGVVLRLHAAPGKKRMLNMDDPTSAVIVELYNPEKLQARIDVPLNEAAALSAGQTVELVSDLLPNKTFTGKVTRISGQADLQRNTLQAKVSIQNPDPRLRPDMLMRAKFYSTGNITQTNSSTASSPSSRLSIYVPEAALVSETQVWVVTPDQTAEKRIIKLGPEKKENHRRVIDGLRSGESVILPPHDKLKPQARIKIIN